MNRPKLYAFITIFAAFFLSSCYSLQPADNSDVIVIEDDSVEHNYETGKDEIVLTDSDIDDSEEGNRIKSKKREEKKQISNDDSTVSTMYDGTGNKTETRFFNKHSRIKKVIVRTSVDGTVRIFVYGQNGKLKRLPSGMKVKALSATGDEIANAAKIYESREQRDRRRADEARLKAERLKADREERANRDKPEQPEKQPDSPTEDSDSAPGETGEEADKSQPGDDETTPND